MTRALVTSSRYSPGNLTPEALEKLFVGREDLLEDILRRVNASALGAEKHFLLLVGARGVGKTHFMALLNHRLQTDRNYAKARKQLKIAYLNEEEWGVASFLDFLVRILRSLAVRYKSKALSAKIEGIYAAFQKSPDAALDAAQSALLDFVNDDTLLLMCENLVDLFQGLGEEGQQRWRAFIQEHACWTIVATTPALFSDIQLQKGPFYGFFTIRYLAKLDFESALTLLRQKAMLEKELELADFLMTPTGRARVRAIHHLAQGNHRVYVIMSDFLDKQSLDDLVNPFMRMVDDLTPYYQDRMRQLAPAQRKIIEFLSHERRPINVKTIAASCLMSQQTTAKQLGELSKSHFVLSNKAGRETFYELAEPLMRICVDVKDNRTEHLKLFVEFLRQWFSVRELQTKLETLSGLDIKAQWFDRLHIEAAIHECAADSKQPFLDSLGEEARLCFDAKDYRGLAEATSRLIEERKEVADYEWNAYALYEMGDLPAAVRSAERGIEVFPDDPRLSYQAALCLYYRDRFEEAISVLDKALARQPRSRELLRLRGDIFFRFGMVERSIANEDELIQVDPTHLHSYYIKGRALLALGRVEEASSMASYLSENASERTGTWTLMARVAHAQGKLEDEVNAWSRALQLDPNNGYLSYEKASALQQLGRLEEAITQYDHALSLDPGDDYAQMGKAEALFDLGKLAEAAEICRTLIGQRPPEQIVPHLVKMLVKLGEWEAALKLTDDLLKQRSDRAEVFRVRGTILLQQSQYASAVESFRRATELKPSDLNSAIFEAAALVGSEGFGVGLRAL
ncbi:MAG TPA: tetratricopeptide repeat protein, partial [Polyangium sp.]|nr:tetratricopeptide repeat protein [Polyangium sp.]